MVLKTRLFTPGPTPIPPFVRDAIARSYEMHHRHKAFREVWQEVSHRLEVLWGVEGPVVMLFGSGTAGMDSAVASIFQPGDQVLVGSIGKFGERWIEIARRCGLDVITLTVPWGEALDPEAILDLLEKHPDVRGILLQACETSTGVENPLSQINEALKSWEGVVVVDAITGLGSMDMEVLTARADVLISASQKAWMLPPGMSLVWLSPRAWSLAESHPRRPFYLDLVAHRDSQVKGDALFTPSIPLVVGLKAVLDYLESIGGLSALVGNCQELARLFRPITDRVDEWQMFPRKRPAHALTAIALPEGVDGVAWVQYLRERYGVVVAGGQGQLKGRIFRVSHLGYIDRVDILGLMDILEDGWHQYFRYGHA